MELCLLVINNEILSRTDFFPAEKAFSLNCRLALDYNKPDADEFLTRFLTCVSLQKFLKKEHKFNKSLLQSLEILSLELFRLR